MNTFVEERPDNFALALVEHMFAEAQDLFSTEKEDHAMQTTIIEIPSAVVMKTADFNVGEIIATPVNDKKAFPHRPHGIIRVEGNVEAAIDALSPWINAEVKVEGVSWTWADSIEESLRVGESVNFDALPAGVILESLAEGSDSRLGAQEEAFVPAGWTGKSLMEAVFEHRQKRNTGVDRR